MKMPYSEHFAPIIRAHGPPNLNTSQYLRLMNIVALENRIHMGRLLMNACKESSYFHQFQLIIFKQEKQLAILTGNMEPALLLSEMQRFSMNSR